MINRCKIKKQIEIQDQMFAEIFKSKSFTEGTDEHKAAQSQLFTVENGNFISLSSLLSPYTSFNSDLKPSQMAISMKGCLTKPFGGKSTLWGENSPITTAQSRYKNQNIKLDHNEGFASPNYSNNNFFIKIMNNNRKQQRRKNQQLQASFKSNMNFMIKSKSSQQTTVH